MIFGMTKADYDQLTEDIASLRSSIIRLKELLGDATKEIEELKNAADGTKKRGRGRPRKDQR